MTKKRNSLAFAEVTSEEQAYWLGFLAADGSIKDRHALVVHLSGKDRGHLDSLRDFLESEHAISIGKDGSVSLTIYDRSMVADLHRVGVRSDERRFAPLLLPHLERHYFRGLFDGDGYIGLSANGLWQLTLGTDRDLCVAFAERARFNTSSKARVFFADGVWRCTVGGQEEPRKLAAWLYQDASIFLPRKQAKFLEMTNGTGIYVDRSAGRLRSKELAKLAGMTARAVLKQIQSGQLAAVRIGPHWWVDPTEAERWYRQFDENLAVA